MRSIEPETPRRHIAWLAAPETRGHLERAHTMRELLAERQISVHVFTTSRKGVEYLDSLGTSATLLESGFGVEFDPRQNLERRETASRMVRYFVDPEQFFEDLSNLREVARRAAFIVNDFHPALLVGGSVCRRELRTVHLYGNNLWHAIARPFRQPVGRFVNPICSELLDRLRRNGAARVIHRPLAPIECRWTASDTVELPPLVPPGGDDLEASTSTSIAVRLNPQFRDPAIARSIEYVAERLEADLHPVGEGFRDREGWRATDPRFVDRAAAADLLISTAELRSIGLARAFGTPLVMAVPDQPAQVRNANAFLQADDTPPCRGVDVETPRLHRALYDAAGSALDEADGSDGPQSWVDDIHTAWSDAFVGLIRRLETREICRVA